MYLHNIEQLYTSKSPLGDNVLVLCPCHVMRWREHAVRLMQVTQLQGVPFLALAETVCPLETHLCSAPCSQNWRERFGIQSLFMLPLYFCTFTVLGF